MAEAMELRELVLMDEVEEGERRSVSVVSGDSLALVECSSGPVTAAAYGTDRFLHKMMCDRDAFARVLGVHVADVCAALSGLFARSGRETYLSDIMDRFDRAGETYTYVAWDTVGDVAFRAR